MLERLEIHNYALIEDSTIEFGEGFTVITGETGAGKSIILGALSLLLGQKAEVQSIRSGAESASVAASFYVGENAGEYLSSYFEREELTLEDGSVILRRTVRMNGRSSTTIQGRIATRADLIAISSELLDISAQRDHQSLLRPSSQLSVLDTWGECIDLRAQFRAQWEELGSLAKRRSTLVSQLEASRREADYLSYAIEEIEALEPKAGEDSVIEEQIKIAASSEQLWEATGEAASLLHDGSFIATLHRAQSQIGQAAKTDKALLSLHQRLESATIEIQDIYESLRDYLGQITFSADELDRLQGRLSTLQRLKKKYGPTLEGVIEFYHTSRDRLLLEEEGEHLLKQIDRSIETIEGELARIGMELRTKRKRAAATLEGEVVTRLRTLGMESASFSILFEEAEPSSSGLDTITFAICANVGMEMLPIASVASGGELSRIMLAIKTTLAASDAIPTLIFDEVDAGIGGSVARSVAEQLERLAQTHQVIVITHLASIASKATTHLVVHKEVRDQMSYSLISAVSGTTRQREIARMLSGDAESQESLEHALKLLAERE
jgi:DNA repair protein RecN (Recombination protein N)